MWEVFSVVYLLVEGRRGFVHGMNVFIIWDLVVTRRVSQFEKSLQNTQQTHQVNSNIIDNTVVNINIIDNTVANSNIIDNTDVNNNIIDNNVVNSNIIDNSVVISLLPVTKWKVQCSAGYSVSQSSSQGKREIYLNYLHIIICY